MKNSIMPSARGSRPRWMLVDDNQDVLLLMREIVSRFSDADIECFNSSQAALDAFAAAPEAFELVITDLEMPGMNGIELNRRLLALAPTVKILLATGSGLVSDEVAARAGFSGLLHKPFPFAVLRRTLEAIGLGKNPETACARLAAAVAA